MEISIILAFVAGLVSFFSPCVLPLVPGYIFFISGVFVNDAVKKEQIKFLGRTQLYVVFNALLFVIGFSFIFVALGASATWIGSFLGYNIGVFTKIAGLIIIFFGLIKLDIISLNVFFKDTRFNLNTKKKGVFFSLLLGMTFAFGWTPCIGPVLGAILTYAGTSEKVNAGIWLLLIYSTGLGIPFILTAIFIQYFFKIFNKIKNHLWIIDKVTGIVLIIIGILIFTDSFASLARWFGFLDRFAL